MNPLINPMKSIGASILFNENAAQETNENSAVEAVIATEQNAEDERCKGIGRDQPGGLGSKERKSAALAKHEQDLRRRKLEVDDAKDEKDARIPQKRFWLIDPELRHRGGEEEEGEDKVRVGSGCCPLKISSASPATNATKIVTLIQGAYSRLRSISLGAWRRRVLPEASPRLHEAFSVQEFEHRYFRTEPPVLAGERCCW